MSARPGLIYIVLATSSSDFHPPSSDPAYQSPLFKSTTIENVFYDRNLANVLAKEYFIRQHPEDLDEDANEDECGFPTPRAAKWGIWVPSETTRCVITEKAGLCRIEVVVGEGLAREEFLVEVVEEEIPDASGPLSRGGG
ncbi:MAG: hypothetical protein HETSPECPRED_009380 [Heterodermia speciosa]|uniref:Uncharacterized protein n=1 Tax=Heterodermia speciosa TaxID=116794 RepID=A0A8H3G1F9_9LECA|nr:MAG: hypothetical protein HETSPECPRED_009380 [Heterodermia speciosa]